MADNSHRTALITGASSGIGEATARQLAELGFTVYASARRVDRMSDLAARGIRTSSVDVCDDDSMVTLVETVIAETGRIDVLVNNAGYGLYGALEDVPIDEARRQFDVNVFGLARMTQLVLPYMRAQRDGYIVNISSMGGKIWEPLGSWYHASKFAVEGLIETLRYELRPFDIKVTLVELSERHGRRERDGVSLPLPLTRQDLAALTGTTIYTASRIVADWVDADILESHRARLRVKRLNRLIQLASA